MSKLVIRPYFPQREKDIMVMMMMMMMMMMKLVIGWKLSFCLLVPTIWSQTRTQSLFAGEIGLFQRESGVDRARWDI